MENKMNKLFTNDELSALLEMGKKMVNDDYARADELVCALRDLFAMTGFKVYAYYSKVEFTEAEIKSMLSEIARALAVEIKPLVYAKDKAWELDYEKYEEWEIAIELKLMLMRMDAVTFAGLKNMIDYYKEVN